MNKYFLGIFGGQGPNPSAVLLNKGKILSFCEEERFLRIKNANSYLPLNSINYCLKKTKISINNVKEIAFAWDCPNYKKNFLKKKNNFQRKIDTSSYYNYKHEQKLSIGFDDIKIKEDLKFGLAKFGIKLDTKKIRFFPHHKCHAASAFYCSGFSEALILVIDGSGENITTSIWHGKNNNLKIIKKFELPDTLGGYYSTFTEFLGFKSDSEEGKLMGLAAYGKYSEKIQKKISKFIKFDKKKLTYSVDNSYRFNGKRLSNSKFTEKFIKLFGKPRVKGIKINRYHEDLSFNVQFKLEQITKNIAQHYLKKLNINNICLAGGVAMNCKMNGTISNLKEVKNIFIQPAASDNGSSLGAAYLSSILHGQKKFHKLEHVYFGPEFSNKEILKSLKESKLKYKYIKDVPKDAADNIYKKKIVAWFQGKAEFGARSLGARSILANPTYKFMKSKLNLEVKHRENWRPFCPSILSDDSSRYFECKTESPFMILAKKIKKKYKKILPSIVHIDDTVRPQEVKKKYNKKFYDLLKNFKKKTGHGVLINTSFNIQGEPIVNTPSDAIRCFSGTGIDVLYLGDYRIQK